MVSEAVRRVEDFLPAALHWWTDWYAANAEWFAGGLVSIAVLTSLGSALSGRISETMRVIWQTRAMPTALSGRLHGAIYAFRMHPAYRFVINVGKRHVAPAFLAFLMVWYGATILSHFAFNAADSMGAFCSPSSKVTAVDLEIPQAANDFDTTSICAATGLTVRADFTYEIAITMSETAPWEDDGKSTTPVGYRTSTMMGLERIRGYATIFLRRILFRPWFRLIARMGDRGVDEYFLDPVPKANTNPQIYKDKFKAQRSGEVFLYVNDAVVGIPWLYDWFYGPKHHRGKAKVTITLL